MTLKQRSWFALMTDSPPPSNIVMTAKQRQWWKCLSHIKQRESRVITCSNGTERRRFAMKECVDSLIEMGAEPHHILMYLKESFGETTAFTYATTIQAMQEFKHFKEAKKWTELLSEMKLKAAKAERKQARPLTAHQAAHIYQHSSTWPARLALILWISASRYGDLQHMQIVAETEAQDGLTLILINMLGSKGDPDGSRKDLKAIFIPSQWKAAFKDETRKHVISREEEKKRRAVTPEGHTPKRTKVPTGDRPTSMYIMKKAINNVLKSLARTPEDFAHEPCQEAEMTGHSMRVGAIHTLLQQFRLTQIAALTLHGQQTRRELGALTSYTATAHFGEEREKLQMAMSLYLLHRLGNTSLQSAHQIAQRMYLPVSFMSQDTA